MFARNYFSGNFFAPAYFPPMTALVEVEQPAMVGGGGYWDYYEPIDRKAWIDADDDTDIMELIPLFLSVIEGDE
jgi:hypothetical protein